MSFFERSWFVVTLSSVGVIFMLLGLMALALPDAQEGIHIWQLDHTHSLHLMDVAGSFALILGLLLTWLGSKFWNRQLTA